MKLLKVLIKGAGDLASGIAYRLKKAGYDILMTEIPVPATVRRMAAFSRAVYEKDVELEGVQGILADSNVVIETIQEHGAVAVIVDEGTRIIHQYHPEVVIDAIMAKKNLGTTIHDASLVIGIGPGFEAGKDCHAVIETERGHYLGKVIWKGCAIPNSGIPGNIGGFTTERIIRAEAEGVFQPISEIGDIVVKNQLIAVSGEKPIYAQITGIVRGMLQPGVIVWKGRKCGDIDARCDREHCFTISDKARSIGGGVLEVIVGYEHSVNY